MRKIFVVLFGLIVLGLSSCQSDDIETSITPTPLATSSVTPAIGVTLATVTQVSITTITINTPTISASPPETLSPTPNIYRVELGDTLFDIAATHNSTIEEILSLNPGLQPELLLIGQEVVLPHQAVPIVPPQIVTIVPTLVEVAALSSYETTTGGLWILGEVLNSGQQSVENVQVKIHLVDATGQHLYTTQAWITATLIESGGKAPFGVLVNPAPPSLVTPQVVVESAETVVDLGNRYLDLAVSDAKVNIEGSRATFSGLITNTGQSTAEQISLFTTIYDDQGNVTGYHELRLEDPLGIGEQMPFEIHLVPPGFQIEEYSFLLQGFSGEIGG